jgi:sulfate permease, SulP family
MFKFIKSRLVSLKTDFLSGFTVALALVPEAVAFAFVAGVEPLVGLYAAFIVGLITGIFGGRPGMISGATGALAVVIVSLVSQHGLEYLFATVVLMGIIQIVAGTLKVGKLVRLIPYSVLLGVINGLAIVIFLSQLEQFQYTDSEGVVSWLSGSLLWTMIGLALVGMSIIYFLPKLTKAIPASLVSIIALTVAVHVFGVNTLTVLDMSSISGGLPEFHLPIVPLTFETLQIIFPYACILAAVGLTESLITLQLVDEVTKTEGNGNKECVAQGLANVVTGFFGGMGGCAMIGQSMINVNSGGRRRTSAIVAALALLFFIVVAPPLIEMIPLAALVGVMMMVVIGSFEWSSFRLLGKIPRTDAIVIVLVSVVTVVTNLAIGVLFGVIISALSFAWKKSKRILSKEEVDQSGVKCYSLDGPLFFGSIQSFKGLFSIENDPKEVIIDFKSSRVYDHSAIEAINYLLREYGTIGKKITFKNLSANCRKRLEKAEVKFKSLPLFSID